MAARSRRAVLTAGVAGLAAIAAQVVGRSVPVRAGAGSEGDPLVVGGEYYDARTKTYIANNTNADYVLAAQSTTGGIALSGASNSNYGVSGTSATKYGVYGESGTTSGVYGTGVVGVQGNGPGMGLYGKTTTGVGVFGEATHGVGAYGIDFGTGIGLYCRADNGDAIQVDGRANFVRSGIAVVGVGAKALTVTTGFDLRAVSQVFCTLDTNQTGLFLHHVTKDTNADTFKITLSTKVASGKYAKVAWVVFK